MNQKFNYQFYHILILFVFLFEVQFAGAATYQCKLLFAKGNQDFLGLAKRMAELTVKNNQEKNPIENARIALLISLTLHELQAKDPSLILHYLASLKDLNTKKADPYSVDAKQTDRASREQALRQKKLFNPRKEKSILIPGVLSRVDNEIAKSHDGSLLFTNNKIVDLTSLSVEADGISARPDASSAFGYNFFGNDKYILQRADYPSRFELIDRLKKEVAFRQEVGDIDAVLIDEQRTKIFFLTNERQFSYLKYNGPNSLEAGNLKSVSFKVSKMSVVADGKLVVLVGNKGQFEVVEAQSLVSIYSGSLKLPKDFDLAAFPATNTTNPVVSVQINNDDVLTVDVTHQYTAHKFTPFLSVSVIDLKRDEALFEKRVDMAGGFPEWGRDYSNTSRLYYNRYLGYYDSGSYVIHDLQKNLEMTRLKLKNMDKPNHIPIPTEDGNFLIYQPDLKNVEILEMATKQQIRSFSSNKAILKIVSPDSKVLFLGNLSHFEESERGKTHQDPSLFIDLTTLEVSPSESHYVGLVGKTVLLKDQRNQILFSNETGAFIIDWKSRQFDFVSTLNVLANEGTVISEDGTKLWVVQADQGLNPDGTVKVHLDQYDLFFDGTHK